MSANTPTFGSSDNEEIHDWLFMVEEGFISCGIPDAMQLHVVAPFLRGGALKSLKRYTTREGETATWNDFRDQLIKEYEPHDIQNRLKDQLMRLKQSETFEKYVTQFKSLVNRIDNISDEDTVLLFTEGLQPKTRLEVLNKRCPNLEEAIIYAESCLSRPIEVNLANFRKNYNRQSKSNLSQVRCFRCHKLGHLARNCFEESGAESLEIVQVQIKKNPIWCAIDCGAIESILSVKVARELGILVNDSDKRIKSVNNQITDVIGETEKVDVDIGDHKSSMNFIVIDLDDYVVLLGLDWLGSAGVNVDYSNNLMYQAVSYIISVFFVNL
jgi:hypothetical protein